MKLAPISPAFQILAWILGIIISFGGFLYWQIDTVRSGLDDVRLDLAVVRTDTSWIKQNLERKVVVSVPLR